MLLRNTYLYTKVHSYQNMRYHTHPHIHHHMFFHKDQHSKTHSLYYNHPNNPEHMIQDMLYNNIDNSLIYNLLDSHHMLDDYLDHQYTLPYNLSIHRSCRTGQHILHRYNC